ncbi:MAG: tyrosine phosphatase family protein [Rhizobium sp.]|nr:tyrosine phosphatase family protein [Rhizobium sp.]
MPRIVVSPLKTIGEMAARHKAREMITLIAENHDFHRPGIIDPGRHLSLKMNDIAFVGKEGLIAPQAAHVADIIAFVQRWDQTSPLLIHCWMGVSRSPAAALIAALAASPDLDDAELAAALRRSSPQASPNTRLVEIGDDALSRSGRLVTAVKAIGRGAEYQGDAPFVLDF